MPVLVREDVLPVKVAVDVERPIPASALDPVVVAVSVAVRVAVAE
jgi:hypothetical protein